MARRPYQIGYTSGKKEILTLSEEEVRLLRFNRADENKIVCTILPLDYLEERKRQRAYAR